MTFNITDNSINHKFNALENRILKLDSIDFKIFLFAIFFVWQEEDIQQSVYIQI